MVARIWRQRVSDFLVDYGPTLVRLAIAAATLVFSAILAPLAADGRGLPWLLIGGGLALAGAVILLRWPGLGFPVLIFSSLLIPFDLGTGTQTSINVAVLLVAGLTGLWVWDMVARERRLTLAPSRTIPPILAFVVVALLALGFGQLRWLPLQGASIPAQLGGFSIFLFSACAFLVSAHRISDERPLRWMAWTLIILGGIYVSGVVVPGEVRLVNRTFQRPVDDSLFWVWLVAMSVSQALINRRLPTGARLGLAGVALASMYVMLVVRQSWTSGWLPALAAAYVILFLRMPRLAIVAGVLGGVTLLASNIFFAGDNTYSMETRLEAWRIMAELIKRSPILGLGPSNYYFYTPYYSILGYYVQFNSHNNYIDILAQTGLAGLACFAWFCWEVGRVGWRLRSKVPAGFSQAYVFGVLGGLAGTLAAGMFGDWVLPFVYNVGMAGFRASMLAWLFFGGLVALERLYLPTEKHAPA